MKLSSPEQPAVLGEVGTHGREKEAEPWHCCHPGLHTSPCNRAEPCQLHLNLNGGMMAQQPFHPHRHPREHFINQPCL